MRTLLETLSKACKAGLEPTFCSILETRGSTPQSAGAAMLLFEDGKQVGTLGGGCIEAEVRQRALAARCEPNPRIHEFSLDKDYGWDDGLICGGQMRILTAGITTDADQAYYEALERLVVLGRGCTESVIIESAGWKGYASGDRFLFDQTGELLASLPPTRVAPEGIHEWILDPESRPRARTHQGIAIIPHLPRCRLIIVGAGHVGQALAQIAAQVDFDVCVIDDRESCANRKRFPLASDIIVGDMDEVLRDLETSLRDYCVIVTRGHHHDEEALYRMVNKTTRYLGLIGSQRKIRLIFDDLRDRVTSPDRLIRVHAPLGFDIGSSTVPEIAVSIVAELIAHRNLGVDPGRRTPGTLSERLGID